MRKLGHEAIQSVIKRACKEFLEDNSAPEFVSFLYKGHYVEAEFEWSSSRCLWYVSRFCVVYSRCVMHYNVNEDYDFSFACCW